ncbi:MAG TPA: ATP-dependent DNA ligase [Vicinamibacterales bacterium]|nr:ATP-dependent DNA ligase [Vicinamibacterales bacterium]
MLIRDLASTSAAVANASGRLAKIGHLATLLRALAPEEVDIAIGFLSGEPRQGRMGLGPSTVWQAKPTTTADTPTLTLAEVDETFTRISAAKGAGSPAERSRLLIELLRRATREERDFLVRLLVGELRQGALEGVLLEAVARASNLPAAAVRRAAMIAGALAPVAHAALVEGDAGLRRFLIRIFQPVQPMLAQPAADLDEALAEIEGDLALEWKLDGARIQVHKAGDEIKVFSRNLRDVTSAVPEVVETVRALAVREAIFDGEVIALRSDTSPHDFQVTMQRFGRKLDVDRLRAELPLVPFFFDCLYVDGAPLIDESRERRFTVLDSVAPSLVVPNIIRPTREDSRRFLDETLARGHEGVMAKALGSSYEAGRRGQHWLKIKAARTLDLVVLAVEWGHGRRRGWLSNLHLGARDPVNGAFVMLGKTFKGLTDEMLAWQTEKLLALEIARDDYTVYVRPELVVEIAFNGVQDSPHYPGGLALRFARVKAYRPEKSAAEADTIEIVRRLKSSLWRS